MTHFIYPLCHLSSNFSNLNLALLNIDIAKLNASIMASSSSKYTQNLNKKFESNAKCIVSSQFYYKSLTCKSSVDRLGGDTCSHVCPHIWFNEARTNIGLSPIMRFLNENDSLAYFAILVELSSGLSFIVGLFKTLNFPSLLVGFFRVQGMTYLPTP